VFATGFLRWIESVRLKQIAAPVTKTSASLGATARVFAKEADACIGGKRVQTLSCVLPVCGCDKR
jgi:hypothetical protein